MFCAFDTDNSVDLIYTDIAKAFDSVISNMSLVFTSNSKPVNSSVFYHSIYGIMGNLLKPYSLKRIECSLTDRTQLVCVNNQYSSFLYFAYW